MSATRAIRAVKRGRKAAESLMIDRCTIGRPGQTVTDPLTGEATATLEPVYPPDGKPGACKVNTYEPYETPIDIPGHRATLQRYVLHLPVTSGYMPQVGDQVTISDSVLDPNLVGNTYRIAAPMLKSMATAYRVHIEEIAEETQP